MTDLVLRLSLEQSLEVQDALRRNDVSLAELKKLTSGNNLRKAIDRIFLSHYYIITLPKMVGKQIWEVHDYLRECRAQDLATIPDNLNTLPEEFKDGSWYWFFGQDKPVCATWCGGAWHRYANPRVVVWDACCRIVHFEN